MSYTTVSGALSADTEWTAGINYKVTAFYTTPIVGGITKKRDIYTSILRSGIRGYIT